MTQKHSDGTSGLYPSALPPMTSLSVTVNPVAVTRATMVFLCLLGRMCSATEELLENQKRSQVVRITASSAADVNFVRQLRDRFDLDTWRELRQPNTTGDFVLPPYLSSTIRRFLKLHGIPFSVLIDDIARFIADHSEREARDRARRTVPDDGFRYRYLPYDQMLRFLSHVRSSSTRASVHLGSIGQTFEKRETPYVKITSKRSSGPKDTIFLDGGFHSREWISPAMALEIIHRLAFNTEEDAETDSLLDLFDFIIVPLVNPDGYVYTFYPGLGTRMWRKSRTTAYSGDERCFGVDLNRNFGYKWNDSEDYGGSSQPCSTSYSGPHNFSEPEARNLRDLLLAHSDVIKGYLSFHSYGQFLLYPWGYRDDVEIQDEEDLINVAQAFADTMSQRNYSYLVGGSAKSLYPAAGASSDYVRGILGVKYSYTVELPPMEGSHTGFVLPEAKVKTVVTDTWAGLKAFLLRLHSHTRKQRQTTEDSLQTHRPTTDRSEKLEVIKHEMERRLPKEARHSNSDATRREDQVTSGNSINESEYISKGATQNVQDPFGLEVVLADNGVDKNTLGVEEELTEYPIDEDTIYQNSDVEDEEGSMRSGSAKMWSIGDILGKRYNFFNSRR